MFAIMSLFRFSTLTVSLFLLFCSAVPDQTIVTRDLVKQMLDSIRNIKNERCDIKSTERVNGTLLFAESKIKINFNPKKIYFHSQGKGIEILWTEGTNKGNALVHSRTLPFMNLDLDPYGAIMRKDQHHTIFELGSQYIGLTIANTILQASKDFDKHFKYAGIIKWNNLDCYQLVIKYPEYKYVEYITQKGETVTSIAHKLNTSDFKIRHINDLSSYFGTIKEGKKLKIPIPYSSEVVMYVDKKTFIPVNVKVYDEEGIFEGYEFYNIRINTAFAADEFSKTFKGYSF